MDFYEARVRHNLKLDMDSLLKLYDKERFSKNNTEKQKLAHDINNLFYYMTEYNLDDDYLVRFINEHPSELDDYAEYVVTNILNFGRVASDALDIFKKAKYVNYNIFPSQNILVSEDEIINSFLDYFCPEAKSIYRDALQNARIIFDESRNGHLSIVLPTINSYYIDIGTKSANKIEKITCLLFEIMNIYTHEVIRKKDPDNYYNFVNGVYDESIPIYTVMSFINFLISEHGFNKYYQLLINSVDGYVLNGFETINYLYELSKNKIAYKVDTVDYEYEVLDKINSLDFKMHRKEGNIFGLKKSMSYTQACYLMYTELRGEKPDNIIDEYISGEYYSRNIDFYNYDLSCMNKLLKKRNQQLARRKIIFDLFTK